MKCNNLIRGPEKLGAPALGYTLPASAGYFICHWDCESGARPIELGSINRLSIKGAQKESATCHLTWEFSLFGF